MKLHFYLLIVVMSLAACHAEKQSPGVAKDRSSVEVNILKNVDGTFGYEIMIDGKKKVIQPMIPAVQGQRGFKNMQDAFRTGALAAKKIETGQVPPVITLEELADLGVFDQ